MLVVSKTTVTEVRPPVEGYAKHLIPEYTDNG